MLFQARFVPGLRDGSITVTYRVWTRPQVKVGGRYRTRAGMLEVDAVGVVKLGDIEDRDARRSGFADRDELAASLAKTARKALRKDTQVYRVELHFAGDVTVADLPPSHTAWTPEEVDTMTARLDKMDRLSRHGPWTRQVLRAIEKRPRTAASKLAPRLGRETAAFKTDVRKLKKLGLTVSFDVGYEISPRGRAYLAANAASTESLRKAAGGPPRRT